jgi:phosphoadenosine phosphosulfate reductase
MTLPLFDELSLLADNFERSYPHEIVAWAALRFGTGLAMATGFGPEGIVIMHILNQVAPETTIFYLDTDLFFPETYALRDKLEAHFGLKFERISTSLSLTQQNEAHGPELWAREPDQCCRLRKVQPLRAYLKTKQAWITAIRREQTSQRAGAKAIEWDAANGLVKVNPLVNWSSEQVWTYLELFELPYNELHHQGYPSIGCLPCTRPVAEGADPRSGRWVGRKKVECGIHLQEENNVSVPSA